MKKLFFLLFFTYLFTNNFDPFDDKDPTNVYHVNVITGNFNLYTNDDILNDADANGAEKFLIARLYSSSGALLQSRYKTDLKYLRYKSGFYVQGGWTFLPHLYALQAENNVYKAVFLIPEKNGELIKYISKKLRNSFYNTDKPKKLKFNTFAEKSINYGSLGGEYNLANNELLLKKKGKRMLLILTHANGSILTYKRYKTKSKSMFKTAYKLVKEKLPNKHIIRYHYDEKTRLSCVELETADKKKHSYFKINYKNNNPPYNFTVKTSEGNEITYNTIGVEKRNYFSKIINNKKPSHKYIYTNSRKGKGQRLEQLFINDKKQFFIKYYRPKSFEKERELYNSEYQKEIQIDKVQSIMLPLGKDGEMVTIAEFFYEENCTTVKDQENVITKYFFDEDKLTEIHYFDNEDNLFSMIKFIWDENKLIKKIKCDKHKRPVFAKTFQYDDLGNIIKETLYGNLTGKNTSIYEDEDTFFENAESISKWYKYNNLHKKIYEKDENGLCYTYKYKKETTLQTAKFTKENDSIIKREFNTYNDKNLITSIIIDDGDSENINDLSNITRRMIKRFIYAGNSIKHVQENEYYLNFQSNEETLLKSKELIYENNKVVEEKISDTNGYLYSIYYKHDKYGNVIEKTNPNNDNVNTYKYDENNLLIEKKEIGHPHTYLYYDEANRHIKTVEYDKERNIISSSSNRFDPKGRLIEISEGKNLHNHQKYDCFGNCIETVYPKIFDENGNIYSPNIRYTFDLEGNISSVKNPKGETTYTTYNLYRKITKNIDKEGNVTLKRYSKKGLLKKEVFPNNTYKKYKYDLFERKIYEALYDDDGTLLFEEKWKYNTFYLLSYTNPNGLTTYYFYDDKGKKIEEKTENRIITYKYDSLGFLSEKSNGITRYIQKNDLEGKPILKSEQTMSYSTSENITYFYYDIEGYLTKTKRITSNGEAIDYFTYDIKGNLINHLDPLKNSTKTIYNYNYVNELDQKVLQITNIDQKNNIKIDTYDALGHLMSTEKKDPLENTLLLENFYYDKAGNKTCHKTTTYENNLYQESFYIYFEYNPNGKVIKQIEENNKITEFEYDNSGNLTAKNFPLHSVYYEYDKLGNVLSIQTSDYKTHYKYKYDKNNLPICIIDMINAHVINRLYNHFGDLIEESHSNGLKYTWKYDDFGRTISFSLPDQSQIEYKYINNHLKEIIRKQKDKSYKYTYHSYDINGHVSEESFQNLPILQSYRDILERPTHQKSTYFHQSVAYDPAGLIIKTENSLHGKKDFDHDSLNQLKKENEKEYFFDSLGNNKENIHSKLHEILQTENEKFQYNKNGCPKRREHQDGSVTIYKYDALNRLKSIKNLFKNKIIFEYDGLSRVSAKREYSYERRKMIFKKRTLFLYDKEFEIGSSTEELEIKDLKILGLGIKGDVGAAIAIEIKDDIYVPIHDFQGNIIALLSEEGHLVESYPMDAFGNDTNLNKKISPWRFSSKRHLSGLVLFKERFYDPSLNRWLSPDPAGFVEGINLYLYSLNDPINRLDLFGLTSENFFDNDNMHSASMNLSLYHYDNYIRDANWNAFVPLTIKYNDITTDAFISSSRLQHLTFSPEEKSKGSINLFNHFDEIIPKNTAAISLATVHNGIMTKQHELIEMADSVRKRIPAATPVLAVHTPTNGFIPDIMNAGIEVRYPGAPTKMVCLTKQFLISMLDNFEKVNPKGIILMNVHSRAGGIWTGVFANLSNEYLLKVKMHMVGIGLGPSLPLEKKVMKEAINIYSRKDFITGFIGLRSKYLYFKNNIHFVPAISKKEEYSMGIADHAFMGSTYQKAVKKQLNKFNQKYGFYDEKTR